MTAACEQCGAPRGTNAAAGVEWTVGQCRRCWLWLNDPRYGPPHGVWTDDPRKAPARGPCLHLGVRTEFREGCGGATCRHACAHPDPAKRREYAVPATVCQRCDFWEAD